MKKPIMKYCKVCLQPSTRPGLQFNEEGICHACVNESEKHLIDWDQREKELLEISEWAKKNAKGHYHAVIGISGGKDSTFQALYAKERLGLNCLLVNTEPDDMTEAGRKNLENLLSYGFDIIKFRPDTTVLRRLAKEAFYEILNPVRPGEFTLVNSPYIVADRFEVPLIIQGENPAITLGVTGTGLDKGGNALHQNEMNTMAGASDSEFVRDDVAPNQLFMYQFPDKKRLINKGIKAIYLQYYAKEWSQVYNADFSVARGLVGRFDERLEDIGRYRRFTAIDSDMVILNQTLKYYKFGFGFATDEACYDIREGRLTREEGKYLIERYDGRCGEKYIQDFCKWINISVDDFWSVVAKHVNKDLFAFDESTKQWLPKFTVGEDFYG